MNESLLLLQEGVPMDAIDKAATRFGMPMGRSLSHDLVGLDTAVLRRQGAGQGLSRPRGRLADPAEHGQGGRLGKKSGLGFRKHCGKRASPRPTRASRRSSEKPQTGDRSPMDEERSPIACSCRCCWRRRGCSKKGSSASRATSTWA